MKDFVTQHLQKGSVVLITGASSDIGWKIAERFTGLGINIMAHYSSNAAELEKLPSSRVALYQADLRHDDAAKKLVEAAIGRFGRLDALINTIGPFAEHDLLGLSVASWREMMDLNLNVAFSMSHYASPFLIESRGQILNFTYAGVDNLTSWPEATAYAAAKAGLAVLTKSSAAALASKGLRVNAISPGWIDFGKFTPEKKLAIERQIPMGRLGRPDEVVDLAQWIMFNSPEFMTGAMIPLGGGLEF